MTFNNWSKPALNWFEKNHWRPQVFQLEAWETIYNGYSGLLSAPTGTGKTYALLVPFLLKGLSESNKNSVEGLQLIWITPIRALAKEIELSAQRAVEGLGLNWQIGIRTGDTAQNIRKQQLKNQLQKQKQRRKQQQTL